MEAKSIKRVPPRTQNPAVAGAEFWLFMGYS